MDQPYTIFRRCLLTASLLPCLFSVLTAQHFYYAPNSTFLPGISEKHDAGVQIARSWGPIFNAWELQAAYSPVNHLAVVVSYFDNGGKNVMNGSDIGTRFHFPEAGLCAYRNIQRGTASIYAAYGQSTILNFYEKSVFTEVSMQRWFVQPSLEYRDAFTRAGLMLRLSRVTYTKGQIDFVIPENELIALRAIEKNSSFFLPELGLSCALKLHFCYLGLNYTVIFPNTDGLHFTRMNASFSLMADIGEARNAVIKKRKGKAG